MKVEPVCYYSFLAETRLVQLLSWIIPQLNNGPNKDKCSNDSKK